MSTSVYTFALLQSTNFCVKSNSRVPAFISRQTKNVYICVYTDLKRTHLCVHLLSDYVPISAANMTVSTFECKFAYLNLPSA